MTSRDQLKRRLDRIEAGEDPIEHLSTADLYFAMLKHSKGDIDFTDEEYQRIADCYFRRLQEGRP